MPRTWWLLFALAALPARAEEHARAPEWALRGGVGAFDTVALSGSLWPLDWLETELHAGTSLDSFAAGARLGPRLHLGGRPLRHEITFSVSAGALVGMRYVVLGEERGAFQGLAPNAVATVELGLWTGPEGGWALQLVAGALWARTSRPDLTIPDFRVSIARLH